MLSWVNVYVHTVCEVMLITKWSCFSLRWVGCLWWTWSTVHRKCWESLHVEIIGLTKCRWRSTIPPRMVYHRHSIQNWIFYASWLGKCHEEKLRPIMQLLCGFPCFKAAVTTLLKTYFLKGPLLAYLQVYDSLEFSPEYILALFKNLNGLENLFD